MLVKLIAVSFLLANFAFAKSNLSITWEGEQSINSNSINEFTASILKKLPSKMKEALSLYEIVIVPNNFAPKLIENLQKICQSNDGNYKESDLIQAQLKTNKTLFKKATRFEINLNQKLVEQIEKGSNQSLAYCKHSNFYQLAQAAIIHELAHIYDMYAIKQENLFQPTAADYEACPKYRNSDVNNKEKSSLRCTIFNSKRKRLSEQLNFQSLLGWRFNTATDHARNLLHVRSPDSYEYKNLEESFAVNFEYYILDGEYKCRRPSLYNAFKQHFGFDPAQKNNCQIDYNILTHMSFNQRDLDPKRIYKIHYLLAAPGKGLSAQFGHAMLRIILCAPERKEVSQECYQDVAHHVVVSYRALVTGLRVSNWDGFVGNYSSRLFLFTFPEVKQEYTVGERRDLVSIPLNLNENQKVQLINQVIEQYWGYSGKYLFLKNNCATETVNLLVGVYNTLSLFPNKGFYTVPTRLLDDLKNASIVEDVKMIEGRYYFSSTTKALQSAVQGILEMDATSGQMKVNEFLEKYDDPNSRREYFFKLWNFNQQESERKKLFSYFTIVEMRFQDEIKQQIKFEVGKVLDDQKENEIRNAPKVKDLFYGLKDMSASLEAWKRIHGGGYGIPLVPERWPYSELEAEVNKYLSDYHTLSNLIETMFPWLKEKVEGSKININAFLDSYKELTK